MKQGINCLKDNRRRMYYIGKSKKYTARQLAIATQRALHLPVTGVFDLRTVIRLNNLKEQSYSPLKTLVNSELSKVH